MLLDKHERPPRACSNLFCGSDLFVILAAGELAALLPKHLLKSWNCLLKSDTCVAALKKLKKEPDAPAFTDSPPWRFTHPFAVISRLAFPAGGSGTAVAFVSVVTVVDVSATVCF